MKIESFSVLNGIALHYLNNLMSGLYGMAQLAQMTRKEDHLEEAVDVTVKNIKKAKNLTAMMARYTEALKNDTGETDLVSILDAVLVLLEHDFEKCGIKVEKAMPEDNGHWTVAARSGDLAEMSFRIIHNSLRSMSENGGKLCVALENNNGEICIKVSDTGSSVRDQKAEDSPLTDFEVARRMAAANNGSFSVTGNSDGGASVTISFRN